MSTSFPLIFGPAGPVATPPETLLAAIIAYMEANSPGYTANLPGSLIDDVSGTETAALIAIDQARVDAVNNISPYAANAYVLSQLGAQFGLPLGTPTNANVYVVFTGTPGYVIPPGFVVSDGANQYVIQDGGAVASGGTSPPLYALCNSDSVFAIPANSVTTVVTSVGSGFSLTVTNPSAGTPAQEAESIPAYRARLLQAYQVAISGTQTYLKTLLRAVTGVNPRLIAVLQNGSKWEVICGGGDQFDVGYAIYKGVSQIGLLVGSSTSPRNITVSLYDAPDTYSVVYVNPPAQVVTVDVTWNTTLTGFTAAAAVNQFIITSVQSYVNSILVGQPINLLVMDEVIQQAVSPVLAALNLTTLSYAVTIDSVPVSPTSGTHIIPSDPESYFSISPTAVTSTQG